MKRKKIDPFWHPLPLGDEVMSYQERLEVFRMNEGDNSSSKSDISDADLERKLKNYIAEKLDEGSDPMAMKGIIAEYMHLRGDY